MTKLCVTMMLPLLLAAGAAAQTPAPTGSDGGATGATSGPGNVNDSPGPTGGMGGQIDPNATGSTASPPAKPPSEACNSPGQQARSPGMPADQNNPSGTCAK